MIKSTTNDSSTDALSSGRTKLLEHRNAKEKGNIPLVLIS